MESVLVIALLLAVGVAVMTFRVYADTRSRLRRSDVDCVKINQRGNVAKFVRSDGRTFWKYYDEYGSAGSTAPTLLPWARVFHAKEVRALS